MNQSAYYEIYQGDTGPILLARPAMLNNTDTLDSNWECYSAAISLSGNPAIASREITDKTDDQLQFIAALIPSETESLSVDEDRGYSEYIWVIEIRNPAYTPAYNREKHIPIKVKAQGITA